MMSRSAVIRHTRSHAAGQGGWVQGWVGLRFSARFNPSFINVITYATKKLKSFGRTVARSHTVGLTSDLAFYAKGTKQNEKADKQ